MQKVKADFLKPAGPSRVILLDGLTPKPRRLHKLALTEEEIKSIRVPVAVLVGDGDDLIKKLYVEPLRQVCRDWPVIEIKDGNHISCILKPRLREEIAAWLKKNSK